MPKGRGILIANVKSDERDIIPLKYFMLIFPALVGGFHIVTSCLATSFLLVFYLVDSKKQNKQKNILYINAVTISVSLIVISYFLSAFWAVDKGMAFLGFVKFLPALPFLLIVMNLSPESRTAILKTVPLCGAVMTVVSYCLHLIPRLKPYFTVAGRLSGFFQYSNSFAVFLICGLIISLYYFEKIVYKLLLTAVLLFGIFESGSRIAFAVMLLALVIAVFTLKDKRITVSLFALVAAGIVLSLVYARCTGNYDTVGRFLTSSLTESTLIGRILYYKDALPVILKHPFGLGYLGYQYTVKSFQTGVYTVAYVHNELLQFLLDIGWIPVIAFIVAIIRTLISHNVDLGKKILLFVLCVHSLFDFDFQYISLVFILVLTLDSACGYEAEYRVRPAAFTCIAGFAILFCGYFSAVDILAQFKLNRYALKLYPVHTNAELELMTEMKTAEQQYVLAGDIAKRNSYISLVYAAIGNYELSTGDIEKYIADTNKAITLSPYDIDIYNDFGSKLISAYNLYINSGDVYSADYCLKQITNLPKKLEGVKSKTSSLAWKINDVPQLELSSEITDFIKTREDQNESV